MVGCLFLSCTPAAHLENQHIWTWVAEWDILAFFGVSWISDPFRGKPPGSQAFEGTTSLVCLFARGLFLFLE